MTSSSNGYKIRKKKFPHGYPQPGTQSARLLECLEAEPATLDEIATYLDTTLDRAGALAAVLMNEQHLVRRTSRAKYQLVNPELVSLIYGSLECEA